MRWEDLRQSINIEDDREASASRGGGFGIPGGGGGLGIGMVIILGLIQACSLAAHKSSPVVDRPRSRLAQRPRSTPARQTTRPVDS